jgi:hypothetical protein
MTRTALAALALALSAAPAAAQNANKWGAIAFGASDRVAGTAVDHATAGAARQAALDACGGQCASTIVFYGACAAVAQNDTGAVGSARNRWRDRARTRAIVACARGGQGCEITAWACTAH